MKKGIAFILLVAIATIVSSWVFFRAAPGTHAALESHDEYLPLVYKSYPPIPQGWVTILEETFEGDVDGTWDLFDGFLGDGEHRWGKRDCAVYLGTYGGWAVGGGANGVSLRCGDSYPNNAESWMVYGPFSLEGAIAAEMRYKAYLVVEPYYDGLCHLASTDGINFYGDCLAFATWQWIDRVLDLNNVYTLGSLLGEPEVWVALLFTSDSSINLQTGANVDNLLLQECFSECGTFGVLDTSVIIDPAASYPAGYALNP